MHLGPERTAAFIRHALDASSYVVCHETLTYGDFPDYGPAICRGFFDAVKMRHKQEAIAKTALPGSRQKRYQPSDRSWNPRERLNRNPQIMPSVTALAHL
jgi:hypothetical protein